MPPVRTPVQSFPYGFQAAGACTFQVMRREPVDLAIDTGAVAVDLTRSSLLRLVLTGAAAIAAPSGMVEGTEFFLAITQDATGGRDVTWNAVFDWGEVGAPAFTDDDPLTATLVHGIVISATKILMTAARGEGNGDPVVGGLADNDVTTAKINALAVTTAKIDNLAVTAGKLAADAVTTAKILDANVTLAKLASGAVNGPKLTNEGSATGSVGIPIITVTTIANANGDTPHAMPTGVTAYLLDAWYIKTGADGGAGSSITVKTQSGATIGVIAATGTDKSKTHIASIDDTFQATDPGAFGGGVNFTALQGAGPTNVAGIVVCLWMKIG